MLSVSNAWKNMFSENLISEALIKFVIQDYGTLYKTDIFSYEFNGSNRFLSDEYPEYNATLKVVMRDDYLNFNNFIRKQIEVYYGFVINGSDEYVKALTLYIDNIEVSDDGRVATFQLKSGLAYLTDTFSIELYASYKDGSIYYYYDFSGFLYSVIGSGNYVFASSTNKSIRFLESKISKGNALQELAFVNCSYIKLQSDGKFYINQDILNANAYTIDPINILNYPHYEKMEYPTTANVDWLDLDNTDNLQISTIGSDTLTPAYQPIPAQWQAYSQRGIDNTSIFALYGVSKQSISSSSFIINSGRINLYNDQYEISLTTSGGGGFVDYTINGYQFNNFYGVSNNQVSIFNININDQTHANLIKSRVETYLSTQKEVELELRIDPSIELLDKVYYANDFKCLIVEKMTITFNGAYRGKISGRFDDTFIAPVVSNIVIGSGGTTYSFDITNPNPYPLTLWISASAGDYETTINAGETLSFDQTNQELDSIVGGSFQEYAQQGLRDEVYCYFESSTTEVSDNTIILEEQ